MMWSQRLISIPSINRQWSTTLDAVATSDVSVFDVGVGVNDGESANMIIARRGTPRPSLSMYVSCLHLLAKWKAGESRLCVYARAMLELCATVPRSPGRPSRVGSEVGSPTPLPALSDRASSSYSPASWSPLAPCVVSTTILVGCGHADVAASPSFGVGGMQAYIASAVPPRQQANRI